MTNQIGWHGSAIYQIKVKGLFGSHLSDWFEEMAIVFEGAFTTITGKVLDQAVLRGLLFKVRDLGLSLISIKRIKS